MNSLYLSLAHLRRDAPLSAIRPLLAPENHSARVSAGHNLVWTLFADATDRKRDFLWREARPGVFYLLSQRLPEDRHGLFRLEEPKVFDPNLAPGEYLRFQLRANATVARNTTPGGRGKVSDVVMNAIHSLPPAERAAGRSRAITSSARAWLSRQGDKNGFSLRAGAGDDGAGADDSMITSYRTLNFGRGGRHARLGVLDFDGILRIDDPAKFLDAVAIGFGRAKAFGCGLMLIRRP